MAPRSLSALYLTVPLVAVPAVVRSRGRSMYTPVPLLVLLALLAGAFGLVPSPQAQAVVHTLLAATLGGSVLHLQVLAGARLLMLVIPVLLLTCATLFSFLPRFSLITPVLFLVFIVTTLGMTVYLFLARRQRHSSAVTLTLTPAPPSPASSHTSFVDSPIEKPPLAFLRSPPKFTLSPRRTSLPQPTCPSPSNNTALILLLSAQLSYTLATAFCIPPALHTAGPPSPLIVSLVYVSATHKHLSSTYIFRILDTAFTVLTLIFIFVAYSHRSRCEPRTDIEQPPTTLTTPKRTPTIPRRPNIRILSPPASPTPTRTHSINLPSPLTKLKLKMPKPKPTHVHKRSASSFFSPFPSRLTSATPEPQAHAQTHTLVPPSPSHSSSSATCVPTPSTPTPTSTTLTPTLPPTPSTPPRPTLTLTLPPGTRMSPGPAARSPVVVTPPHTPVVCTGKRAWSWHTPSLSPSSQLDADLDLGLAPGEEEAEAVMIDHEEGDFRDLRDPFAPAPAHVSVVPSAYRRWAGTGESESEHELNDPGEVGHASRGVSVSGRPRSSSYDAYACPQTRTRTRMSAWGRLPLPLPISSASCQARHGAGAGAAGRGKGLKIDTSVAVGAGGAGGSVTPSTSTSTTTTTSQRVRFNFDAGTVCPSPPASLSSHAHAHAQPPRPRTPPPPKNKNKNKNKSGQKRHEDVGVPALFRTRRTGVGCRDKDRDRDRDRDQESSASPNGSGAHTGEGDRECGVEDAEEDLLIAQRLLVQLGSVGG